MRRLLALSTLFLAFGMAAQDFVDLLRIEQRISVPDPENSSLPTSNLEDHLVDVFLPLEQSEGQYLLTGVSYAKRDFPGRDLYSSAILLGYKGKLKSGLEKAWEHTFLFIPRLSSDEFSLKNNHMQWGLYLLNSKRTNENWTWKYGSYLNQERFGFLLVPLLGFTWQIREDVKLDMSLPVSASLRKTNEKWMYGLDYLGRRYSFQLSDEKRYAEFGDNTLSLFLERFMSNHMVLKLRAGHSILRRYSTYPEGEEVKLALGPVDFGDQRKGEQVLALGNGLVFQFGLAYRFMVEPSSP